MKIIEIQGVIVLRARINNQRIRRHFKFSLDDINTWTKFENTMANLQKYLQTHIYKRIGNKRKNKGTFKLLLKMYITKKRCCFGTTTYAIGQNNELMSYARFINASKRDIDYIIESHVENLKWELASFLIANNILDLE